MDFEKPPTMKSQMSSGVAMDAMMRDGWRVWRMSSRLASAMVARVPMVPVMRGLPLLVRLRGLGRSRCRRRRVLAGRW